MILFEDPIRSGQIRKNIYYYQFRTGIIYIKGIIYSGYSIKDAIKLWRKQNPITK